jgi:hypothetical protein
MEEFKKNAEVYREQLVARRTIRADTRDRQDRNDPETRLLDGGTGGALESPRIASGRPAW